MNGTAARFLRLGLSLAGLVTLAWVLTGTARPAHQGIPLPTDWSHRHLIFSRPGSPEQAARVAEDPRYWQQLHRREQRLALPSRLLDVAAAPAISHRAVLKNAKKFHRDWSQDIGPGASAGAGNYPAKFSFDSTTADCVNDFVIFSTGLTGTATQASIVAYNNLYSGCGGTVPSVLWAYDTSNEIAIPVPGIIRTSPVLSRDGSQIAFVQTDGVSAATVVLLKWKAATGTVSSPVNPTAVAAGAYAGCTAPCMTKFALHDSTPVFTDDTTSSVFYDYTGDTAWVGDSRGWLHKFTPFFTGTPAEIATSPWPVQVSHNLPLGSPVYDHVSANVFAAGVQDGFLYRVDPTTAVVTASGQLDHGLSLLGPIVDSSNGLVYAFAASDGSGLGVTADKAGVFQLSATFTSGTGSEAIVGTSTITGTNPQPLYIGGFDNNYYTSADGTGNLYVCGNTGSTPTLYQVPITAGAMSNGVAITTLATGNPACSPVTDVSDPGPTAGSATTERLFVSVQNNSTTCGSGGCIVSFVDTPWQATTNFTSGQRILVRGANPLLRFVKVVITSGTSGATQPTWPTTPGATKIDGTVTWINQGNPAIPLNMWLAGHTYNSGRIVDSNGNVQAVQTAGTSGATPPPTWNSTPGGTTADGPDTLVWINAGAPPIIGLSETGGTSAIILDNTVGSGVLAGTSQVYFTTLGNQCGTPATDGCAVQASQSGLN